MNSHTIYVSYGLSSYKHLYSNVKTFYIGINNFFFFLIKSLSSDYSLYRTSASHYCYCINFSVTTFIMQGIIAIKVVDIRLVKFLF